MLSSLVAYLLLAPRFVGEWRVSPWRCSDPWMVSLRFLPDYTLSLHADGTYRSKYALGNGRWSYAGDRVLLRPSPSKFDRTLIDAGYRASSNDSVALKATKEGLFLALRPTLGHGSSYYYVRGSLPKRPDDPKTKRDEELFFAIGLHYCLGVRRALANGADPNSSQPASLLLDHVRLTPLYITARMGDPEILKALLDAGADPNARSGPQGMTPLTEAAGHGSLECARLLLGRGANIRLKSKRGLAAVDYARLRKDDKMVVLLTKWTREHP